MFSSTIGVLGGGQLGRMMLEAAHRLNIPMTFLDSLETSPAKQLHHEKSSCGTFSKAQDIHQFVKESECKILTVEIEHVNCDVLEELESENIKVHPSPKTLRIIQNKYTQKQHLKALGLPIGKVAEVASIEAIRDLGNADFGWPLVLKAKRLAYDGRGNYVISSPKDVEMAFHTLNPTSDPDALYVEKWIPFTHELAVMVVRDVKGHVVTYPVVETVHKKNICHVVVAPAQIDGSIVKKASEIAQTAIASFSGAGSFGVELFLTEGSEIFINEIAPRPHNSGHYTIEACHTSQFENHVRAVAGLPLGSTELKVPYSAMINLLGSPDGEMKTTLHAAHSSLKIPGATVHLYGKKECKPGRKMGHITVVSETFPELKDRVALILSAMETDGKINSETVDLTPALRHGSPVVSIIMGSDSDLPVMKSAAQVLEDFEIPFEVTIVSAHRTPQRMFEFARTAHLRGIKIIIAGAGGAAHLPGMVAAITPLPVIGVPVALKVLDGQDSLLSIVQMPRGVPVATVAINNSTNAGLLAVRLLGSFNPFYLNRMITYQHRMEREVNLKVERLNKIGWSMYS